MCIIYKKENHHYCFVTLDIFFFFQNENETARFINGGVFLLSPFLLIVVEHDYVALHKRTKWIVYESESLQRCIIILMCFAAIFVRHFFYVGFLHRNRKCTQLMLVIHILHIITCQHFSETQRIFMIWDFLFHFNLVCKFVCVA